jgi:hypothetical protein
MYGCSDHLTQLNKNWKGVGEQPLQYKSSDCKIIAIHMNAFLPIVLSPLLAIFYLVWG